MPSYLLIGEIAAMPIADDQRTYEKLRRDAAHCSPDAHVYHTRQEAVSDAGLRRHGVWALPE